MTARAAGRGAHSWARALVLGVLCALAAPAHGAVCSCEAGDQLIWSAIDATSGAAFQCSDGGSPSAEDHFVIGDGCEVQVVGDLRQDGTGHEGIEVDPGGLLEVASPSGDRVVLSLDGAGLACHGECRFAGAFREAAAPGIAPDPSPFTVAASIPCDGDCLGSPELGCIEVPPAERAGLSAFAVASDLATGTRDWLCLWDFDRSDVRVSYDDNSCYPVTSADEQSGRVCVDVRQGRDSEYPHRLRNLNAAVLADAIDPGAGCAYPLLPEDGLVTSACGGALLRVEAAPGGLDPIQADDEAIGRFLRFADVSGAPLDASYKILETLDCAAAPPAPHVCGGRSADVVVLGSLDGVAEAHAAGETVWIDYGWRAGDAFFVMSPVQIESATPEDRDTGVLFRGSVDAYGLHLTDLGGGIVGTETSTMVRLESAQVPRWRHVILRNDTGDFPPNNGIDLSVDSLQDETLGHTNILSGTAHAVLIGGSEAVTQGLALEDFSIRHHQDGCFNHMDQVQTPGVRIERSWCAFVQSDAQSAQWLAWQQAAPAGTRLVDSGCDACDGGHHGDILRSNGEIGGWHIERSLLWAPMGTLPHFTDVASNVLFLGLREGELLAAPLLGNRFDRSVARNVSVRANRPVLSGSISVSGSVLRDILVNRANAGAVGAADGSRIQNTAFVGFDSAAETCTSQSCAVIQEGALDSEDVHLERVVIAWPPGQSTRLFAGLRSRALQAITPPRYAGVLVAFHDQDVGSGLAISGLNAGNVGIPDWDDGPCFQGNEADVSGSAGPGLPAETSQGIDLGLADPASYRFDALAGSQAESVGCGLDPADAPGGRGYHYIHARTGLRPELMALDADGDGWPEEVAAGPCQGTARADCRDNCPGTFNPAQEDLDGDGIGDACQLPDADGDSVPDEQDNCVLVPNPGQEDFDAGNDDDQSLPGVQHYGDACDADLDDDGIVGAADFFGVFRPCIGADLVATPACVEADFDGDGSVGPSDFFSGFRPNLGQLPGPGVSE